MLINPQFRHNNFPKSNRIYGWGFNHGNVLGPNLPLGDDTIPRRIVEVWEANAVWLVDIQCNSGTQMAYGFVDETGQLWTWGYNVSYDGRGGTAWPPQTVNAATDWTKCWSGNGWMAALKTDGSLWTTGLGTNYRSGRNTTSTATTFVRIGGSKTYTTAAASVNFGHAVLTDGTVESWGNNGNGVCANSLTTGDTTVPTAVTSSPTGVIALSLGNANVTLLDGSRHLYSAGYNGIDNRAGFDSETTNVSVYTQISPDDDWQSIHTGYWHTLLIKQDGTLWGYGVNVWGMLQPGGGASVYPISKLSDDTDWIDACVGYGCSMAKKSDGSVWIQGSSYTWGVADKPWTFLGYADPAKHMRANRHQYMVTT